MADTYFDTQEVRDAASGRWVLVMGALAPQLEPALRKIGRHVSCPVHGGKDGFRLFRKDFGETGGGVCNTCGPKADGFELLMWLNQWDFWTCKEEVGQVLGLQPREKRKSKQSFKEQHAAAQAKCQPAPAKARNDAQPRTPAKPAPSITVDPEAHQDRVTSNEQPPATMQKPQLAASLEASSQQWQRELQERLNNQKGMDSQRAIESIQRVWSESVSILSPIADPARKYLANRGIVLRSEALNRMLEGDCVRFHPELPYYEEVDTEVEENGEKRSRSKRVMKGKYPALVCAIRENDGHLITLHRTYLTKAGAKAKVEMARKMMAVPDELNVVGAAIQMGVPHDGVLGVAEGLETAASGFRASGIPTWSLISTSILEGFVPPKGVHTVIIWADKDKSYAGERAATVLKARLEALGIRVFVLLPSQPIPARRKGIDWNDVLRSQGILGFPAPRRLNAAIYGQEAANGRA
jgi:hypothetical protein